MGDDTPQVIDLSKEGETDPAGAAAGNPTPTQPLDNDSEAIYDGEHEPGETADPDADDDAGDSADSPADAAREEYTTEGETAYEPTEDDEAAKGAERDADPEAEPDEKEFSLSQYNLTRRCDQEKGFTELTAGDTILIDTPLQGGKTGEVTDVDEAWTGTLHVKVDTGANKYEISPYEDKFSEQFVARIDDSDSVTPDLLRCLDKTEMHKLDVGEQVMLDVPHLGPVTGTVEFKGETETQGTRMDVNTGPVTFSLYENPSPSQQKEQAVLIGRVQ